MLNMALLLHVVNEGEHMVVNQVVEEVNPSVEVGFDNCGTTLDPNFSVNEGKPRMHLNLRIMALLLGLNRHCSSVMETQLSVHHRS